MRNPKTWSGATPWSASGMNDKSGGTHWDNPKKNGDRPHVVKPTPMSHMAAVPKSGDGHSGLMNKSTMMGNPYPKASDRSEMPTSEMSMPKPNMKSMPDVPKDHVKWHKSGRYDMNPNPASTMPMKKMK
jgi:hypothetical protein